MPVVSGPSNLNPVAAGDAYQIQVASQPSSTQMSFAQMIGQVQQYNVDAPPTMVMSWIQNAYRRIIDKRLWYGTMVKGVISAPGTYAAGNVSVTTGGTSVTGNGTAWDSTMVGRQFRVGVGKPVYTIVEVPSPTVLTLDLPWSDAARASTGYQIFQSYYSFGGNIKRLHAVVNNLQFMRLAMNVPQEYLDAIDASRMAMGWTWAVSGYTPSAAGDPLFELYPTPLSVQGFPFCAFTQVPDLVYDTDFPAPFIRADAIVYDAIADAVTFGGPQQNRFYDPTVAKLNRGRAMETIIDMARKDDDLYSQDTRWDFNHIPPGGGGSLYEQSHVYALE